MELGSGSGSGDCLGSGGWGLDPSDYQVVGDDMDSTFMGQGIRLLWSLFKTILSCAVLIFFPPWAGRAPKKYSNAHNALHPLDRPKSLNKAPTCVPPPPPQNLGACAQLCFKQSSVTKFASEILGYCDFILLANKILRLHSDWRANTCFLLPVRIYTLLADWNKVISIINDRHLFAHRKQTPPSLSILLAKKRNCVSIYLCA